MESVGTRANAFERDFMKTITHNTNGKVKTEN